MSNCFKR